MVLGRVPALSAGCRSGHVNGMASPHSAAITQNPCAPTRA